MSCQPILCNFASNPSCCKHLVTIATKLSSCVYQCVIPLYTPSLITTHTHSNHHSLMNSVNEVVQAWLYEMIYQINTPLAFTRYTPPPLAQTWADHTVLQVYCRSTRGSVQLGSGHCII